MSDYITPLATEQLNISGKPLPTTEHDARAELYFASRLRSLSLAEKLDVYFLLNYIHVLNGTRNPNKGYVYLMRCGDVHKIGLSTNPNRRKVEIEEYMPGDIETVVTISTWDTYGLEQSLHSTFLWRRVSGQREWFFLSPSDVNFIKGLAL